MEIIFDKEYLRDLYVTGKADKKTSVSTGDYP